jgi:hypothetical protein
VTITRAWWIVAGGLIITAPGTIAIHLIRVGPTLAHTAHGAIYLGLAVAAAGSSQVLRAAIRQLR